MVDPAHLRGTYRHNPDETRGLIMGRSDSYDFTEAEAHLNNWYTPAEMATELRRRALLLSALQTGAAETIIREMQLAVLNVCDFLDTIHVK